MTTPPLVEDRAPALALVTTLLLTGIVACDVVARLVGISEPWARSAFGLHTVAAVVAVVTRREIRRWGIGSRRIDLIAAGIAGGAVLRVVVGVGQPAVRPLLVAMVVVTGGWVVTTRTALRRALDPPVIAGAAWVMAGLGVFGTTAATFVPAPGWLPDLRPAQQTVGAAVTAASALVVMVVGRTGRTRIVGGTVSAGVLGLALVPTLSFRPLVLAIIAGATVAVPWSTLTAQTEGVGARARAGVVRTVGRVGRSAVRVLRRCRPVGVDGRPPPSWAPEHPVGRRLAAAMVTVATLNVAVDVWWAHRVGLWPIGHGATVVTRAHDVGTAHTPFVGMPTSFGGLGGEPAWHPGPMLFDLLAPWVRLLGVRTGGFVGSAALVLAGWLAGVWAAARAGGRWAAITFWVAGAVVVNVIQRDAVFEPANAFPVVLLNLAVPLLCWAAVLRRGAALALAVVAVSASSQAYLAHAPALVVPLVVALVMIGADATRRGEGGRAARRSLVGAAIAAAVCWARPLAQAVVDGGGNLGTLAGSAGDSEEALGLEGAWRAIAWVASGPPVWGRLHLPFAADSTPYLGHLGWGWVVVVVLAAAAVVTVRNRITTAMSTLWWIVGGAVVGAALGMTRFPDGMAAFYQLVWLAVVSVLVWATGAFTLLEVASRRLERHAPSAVGRRLRAATVALGFVVVAPMVIVLPSDGMALRGRYAWIDEAAPAVLGALDDDRSEGPVVVLGLDGADQQTMADLVVAHLVAEGRDVLVEDYIGDYVGDRRIVPDGWTGPAYLVADGAAPPVTGADLVVRVEPPEWDPVEEREAAVRLKDWVLEQGTFRVLPLAVFDLPAHIEPFAPSMTCDRIAELTSLDVRAEDLPAETIARLYVDSLVASPVLPDALREEVDTVLGVTPFELWRAHITVDDLASARMRRDLSVCP